MSIHASFDVSGLGKMSVVCAHGLAFELENPSAAGSMSVKEFAEYWNRQSSPSLTWNVNADGRLEWTCAEWHARVGFATIAFQDPLRGMEKPN